MRKRKKISFFILLVFICVTGSFSLSEIALRTIGYLGDSERKATIYHDKYGQVKRDSWILKISIDPSTNQLVDIYNQNISTQKGSDELRTIFIGDSATFGAGVPMFQTFPLVFEKKFREKHPDINLKSLNAGVIGLSPIDEYMLLLNELIKLSPDVVVLGLFMANDINFNLAQSKRLEDFKKFPISGEVFYSLRYRSALFHFCFQKFRSINDKYAIINRLGLSNQSQIPIELRLIDENKLNLASYIEGEAALYYNRESSLVNEAYEYLDKTFKNFRILATKHEFEFVVLLIPTASSIMQEFTMPKWPHALGTVSKKTKKHIKSIDFDFDIPFEKVKQICASHNIICLDAKNDFRRAGIESLLPRDDHPSILGHQILAEKLVEHAHVFFEK